MGRYTADCVPFNPHDTLPDARWLSDTLPRPSKPTDILTHSNTKSHYRDGGETHEAIPGATETLSPHFCGRGPGCREPAGERMLRVREDRPASGPRGERIVRKEWGNGATSSMEATSG